MFHHATRLQKILLKPIFKNIKSLFPRKKYRGMFVFVFGVTNTLRNVFVVVNFLFQLIFIFPLFWGMVMYANEFKTKEKQKLTEIKN